MMNLGGYTLAAEEIEGHTGGYCKAAGCQLCHSYEPTITPCSG